VTLCDREVGRGLVDAYIRMGKNSMHSFISLSPIFTGLSCLVLFYFIGRLSRFYRLFSIFCHSFIHSYNYPELRTLPVLRQPEARRMFIFF